MSNGSFYLEAFHLLCPQSKLVEAVLYKKLHVEQLPLQEMSDLFSSDVNPKYTCA